MFGTLDTGKAYSRNSSFLENQNATNDSFSTPLKRLPNANVNSVLHEINEDIHKHTEQHPMVSEPVVTRSSQYAALNDINTLSPLSDASLQVARTRMQNSTNASESLFLKDNAANKPKPKVFFKPLYHNRSILPQDFLPPRAESTGKISVPRLASKPKPSNDEELDTDDDSTPRGEWMSPIMREALSRQVNKERIFKTLCLNIFRFVAFRLAILFAEYCYKVYQIYNQNSSVVRRHAAWAKYVESDKNVLTTVWPYVHHIQWVFLIAIAISLIRLLWPQDQCVDLPLTDKQRQLVGLKPLASGQIDEEGDDFTYKKRHFESKTKQKITPPRYPKISGLVGASEDFSTKEESTEPEIALSDVVPSRTVLPVRQNAFHISKREQELISERFREKFH